jgi:hypothetical protein
MRRITPVLGVFLLLCLRFHPARSNATTFENTEKDSSQAGPGGGYLGSKACVPCHQKIYNAFSRTDMGRSMSTVTPALLREVPNSASVFDEKLNRHFSVSVRNGQLYQSEWETGEDGKDIFRQTERVAWIIGTGANAIGAITQRGEQLFEAPLTFYRKTKAWAVSPGYEDVDRGFSRPIEAECIVCHSGRPNPVSAATGLFRSPPFDELAIGCERCHGAGAAHVRQMQQGTSKARDPSHSIVNPAKLSPWLADNICMSCHQNGDARVLQPEKKSLLEFQPGQPLDDTLAILMAPPTRESPPDSDHVQHYFSMTLSNCYRSSSGRLGCITCHDPHVQPSLEAAPQYFRGKCLACHTEKSCTAPLAERQQRKPPDDCTGCHMAKRDVTIISHASLSNHRIVTSLNEPFPDITFRLTTAELPDLVHLNRVPGKEDSAPPAVTLLQAYGQLSVQRREYLERYFEVAQQLEGSEAKNIYVLEALASRSLQLRTPDGDSAAMGYIARAIAQGSASAWNFEQLGGRLLKSGQYSEALSCLQTGIQRAPYDATLYALLANAYVSLNQPHEAAETLRQASQLFPQMDLLRQLLHELEQSESGGQGADHSQR